MEIAKALDQLVSIFSPRAGVGRWLAREALNEIAKYDERREGRRRAHEAGAVSKRTAGWKASGASANQETRARRALVRNRSRQLIRDNPWATNAVEIYESEVVGTGITPRFMHARAAVVEKAKALWKAHCETTAIDADGRLTLAGMQSLATRTIFESGEVIARRRRRRESDGLPVPFQIELLEPDHLDERRDISQLANGGYIRDGIQIDPLGRREGYWLFPEHPGELTGYVQPSKLIAASEIAHVFKALRPKQLRGVPGLASVMIMLRDLDEYSDAELMKQKVAACLVAFVTDMGGGDDPVTTAGKKPAIPEELIPGSVGRLPAGSTVEFSNPPKVEAFEPFMRGYLRAAAAGSGVTYEHLTGDWGTVTYSSARVAHYANERALARFRWNVVIAQLLEPVMEWFLLSAALAGELPEDGITWGWTPPRRQVLDPKNEIPARIAASRGGLVSPADLLREDGEDPDEVWLEAAANFKRMKELGLMYECDPSNAMRGSPNPAKDAPADNQNDTPKGDNSSDSKTD